MKLRIAYEILASRTTKSDSISGPFRSQPESKMTSTHLGKGICASRRQDCSPRGSPETTRE